MITPSQPQHTHYQKIVANLYARKRFLTTIIFILPLLLAILFGVIKLFFQSTYFNIIQEDAFLENQQAITYLVAAIVSFVVMIGFVRRRRPLEALLFLGFGFALVFVCLEEVSWGERILHLTVPQFFEVHNKQHEINFHNLYIVQARLHRAYILVGLVGAFAWLIVPQRIKRARIILMEYFIPKWYLMFYFLPVAVIYSYFQFIAPDAGRWSSFRFLRINHFFVMRDQEPAETLMALGVLLFVIANKLRQSLTESSANAHAAGGQLHEGVNEPLNEKGEVAKPVVADSSG